MHYRVPVRFVVLSSQFFPSEECGIERYVCICYMVWHRVSYSVSTLQMYGSSRSLVRLVASNLPIGTGERLHIQVSLSLCTIISV